MAVMPENYANATGRTMQDRHIEKRLARISVVAINLACLLIVCFSANNAAASRSDLARVEAPHNTGAANSGPLVAKEDRRSRYRWLLRNDNSVREEPAGAQTNLLDGLDREIKSARRLYLAGDSENAILKYRSAIDSLESVLNGIPPGHPLLAALGERFDIFDELAAKILGPLHMEPRENISGQVFHLMERRRVCKRNFILKRANIVKFYDANPELLAKEAQLSEQLLALNEDGSVGRSHKNRQKLQQSLSGIRRQIRKDSPRYALFKRGFIQTLAEARRDLLTKDDLVLDFNLLRDRMVVGVITSETAVYHQISVKSSDLSKSILGLQNKLQKFTLGAGETFMGHAWKEPCRRIFRAVLSGLPPLPVDKTRVIIIPDGALWYLPFGAMLDTEDRPFGRNRLVSLVPSLEMLRFAQSAPAPKSSSGGLLLFESLPYIPEEELRRDQEPSKGSRRSKEGEKLSEGERIERLILTNPIYPRPSQIVKTIQKMFGNSEAWVGPTATIERLVKYAGSAHDVILMAAPTAVSDVVTPDAQPSLFLSPDRRGRRRFNLGRLFDTPLQSKLLVLPIAWFNVKKDELATGEGPMLLSSALLYSGIRACLINYSSPDWGEQDSFLLEVLKQTSQGVQPKAALADYSRNMPSGTETSFSGKPPAWTGWILMGDPR